MKHFLAALLLFGLPLSAGALEHLIELQSGREIPLDELVERLRGSDFVVLGERHDNPLHHQRRAELVARLSPVAVIVEQLESGRRIAPGAPQDLAQRLADAGFEARAWQWPLHEPLFRGLLAAGVSVAGGNISRDLARRIVREGEAAVPGPLHEIIQRAPLDAAATASLDAELLASHCGQLEEARVPRLRLAQRSRDAAMAESLLAEDLRPAVLLAGNGHGRRDYGVPQILATLRPTAKIVSIAFVEERARATAAYDYLWQTEAAARGEPCAGFGSAR